MDQAEKQNARRRRGGSGPTVADVARLAGVSPMTVSRVINGEARVGAETRARVEAAIAALRYVPNPAARSLAAGGQARLALLHDNPSAAFMGELLLGSLDQARRSDALLLLEPHDAAESVAALCRRLADHRIDGVLIPAPLCDEGTVVGALAAAGLPLARIAATVPMAAGHALGINDEAAAHAMTRHLIALGHRRIAFVGGPERLSVSALRLAGHVRALGEAGIAPDPALIAHGDFAYRSGLTAAEHVLAADPRPTAIFAANDDMAAGVMAAAHRRRLDVPVDLSITGFDDTATARSIWPELTTIRQPAAAMAARGVEILCAHLIARRAGTPFPPLREAMAFTLVRRASDAPPA